MIRYTSGYKYQLLSAVVYKTPYKLEQRVSNDFLIMDEDGTLLIEAGYAWDGASGGVDTKSIMRASLIHDALCQLINEGLLPKSTQVTADWVLKQVCLEDGMSSARAWWVHRSVRRYDTLGLKKYKRKEIIEAP